MLKYEKSVDLIMHLMDLQAASGAEDQVRDYLKETLAPLTDEIITDGLGSLFGIQRSKEKQAPTVMLAGHMDEVAFMVETITKQGLMTVVALGGWNNQVVSAQRFTLQTSKGEYPAVSSSVPPHLLKDKSANVDLSTILFDAGFSSKEEAWQAGVRPGDYLVPDVKSVKTGHSNRIIGKAFDNRYGVAMVIEVLEAFKDVKLPFHLVAGATVQEEVGLRGAKTAVNLIQPDLFIAVAVDASPADDGINADQAMGQLGQGFLLRVQDPGMITPRTIVTWLRNLAEEKEINYQHYFSKGGTDAVAAHQAQEGIPSFVIGCPARYIHTHQSIFDMRDYIAARDMLLAILENLDQEKIKLFKEF